MNDESRLSDPKRLVEMGYDQVAHQYVRLEGEKAWPRMRWLNKLLDRLEPGSSVLDLGCGSGDPADIEISKEHKVTGVDISGTQIALARQNVRAGRFIHGDLGSVEFEAGSFHGVTAFYSLGHLPREQHGAILRRISGWLQPGGLLLASFEPEDMNDVTGEWLGVPMFFSSFDAETVKRLVSQAGLMLLETAIENQLEGDHEVPFLWLLAGKR